MPTFRNTLFHLHRRIGNLSAYEDVTECSETSASKIQAPGNYAEESIQHSEHGESLKSRILFLLAYFRQRALFVVTLTHLLVIVECVSMTTLIESVAVCVMM